jgi:hypothetical protein
MRQMIGSVRKNWWLAGVLGAVICLSPGAQVSKASADPVSGGGSLCDNYLDPTTCWAQGDGGGGYAPPPCTMFGQMNTYGCNSWTGLCYCHGATGCTGMAGSGDCADSINGVTDDHGHRAGTCVWNH